MLNDERTQGAKKIIFIACHSGKLTKYITHMSFQLAPKAFWWTELISQFFCYSNSSKNITCLTGKLKTELTSPITKSTSPGLLNTAFFACWRTNVHWCLGTEHELKFCGISDLFTASKDKSLQAVDMNTGGVAHAVNKAHKYGCLHVFAFY